MTFILDLMRHLGPIAESLWVSLLLGLLSLLGLLARVSSLSCRVRIGQYTLVAGRAVWWRGVLSIGNSRRNYDCSSPSPSHVVQF